MPISETKTAGLLAKTNWVVALWGGRLRSCWRRRDINTLPDRVRCETFRGPRSKIEEFTRSLISRRRALLFSALTFLTPASSITSQAKVKRRTNKPNVEVLVARLTVEWHKLLNGLYLQTCYPWIFAYYTSTQFSIPCRQNINLCQYRLSQITFFGTRESFLYRLF